MLETRLVRLKPYDPRQRHILRRFTYGGIRFQEERGWHRVSKEVSDYLQTIRQVQEDEFSPQAFDVATDAEAKEIDTKEQAEARIRRTALDEIELSTTRGESGADIRSAPSTATTRPETPSAKKKG